MLILIVIFSHIVNLLDINCKFNKKSRFYVINFFIALMSSTRNIICLFINFFPYHVSRVFVSSSFIFMVPFLLYQMNGRVLEWGLEGWGKTGLYGCIGLGTSQDYRRHWIKITENKECAHKVSEHCPMQFRIFDENTCTTHHIYILILPCILFVNSCPSIIWFYTTMKDKKFELNYPVLSKESTNGVSTNIYKMV